MQRGGAGLMLRSGTGNPPAASGRRGSVQRPSLRGGSVSGASLSALDSCGNAILFIRAFCRHSHPRRVRALRSPASRPRRSAIRWRAPPSARRTLPRPVGARGGGAGAQKGMIRGSAICLKGEDRTHRHPLCAAAHRHRHESHERAIARHLRRTRHLQAGGGCRRLALQVELSALPVVLTRRPGNPA